MPNADDAAGRRIVGVMGVAPHVLQMPQAFGSAHATALYTTQAIDRSLRAAHRLIPPVLCVLRKSHGDALSGARPGATGPPGWAPAAVVEYWKSCVSEDEFYF